MLGGKKMNLNSELFSLINGLAHKSVFMDDIMIVFSKYVLLIFMAATALIYIYGALKSKEDMRTVAMDIVVITVINLFISFVIGKFYFVPRPFATGKVNLLIPHTADASFPSDHATGTMSVALGINKYKRAYGIIFIILSIVVGISRVYVGHHYPSDVIGGYMLVFITNYLYTKLFRNKIGNLYIKIESIFLKYVSINNILKG